MNNKLSIWLPLLLALAIVGGMFLQRELNPIKRNGNAVFSKYDEIAEYIAANYVDDVNIDSLTETLLPQLFEKLDPHSSYITTSAYRDMIDPILGSFDGIGVQFEIQNDTVVIIQIIPGGPSEKLNIKAGDRIVTVNNSIIAGKGITNEKTIALLKGPRGTKVTVGIKRHSSKNLIPIEITRGQVPITSVNASYMIDDKTGYIALDCFSQATHDEFMAAMSKLTAQHMQNLIIDLRENGGGLLFTAIELANEFLKKGDTIVFTKGRNTAPEYYVTEGLGKYTKMNLCVLINEYSASASEIFSGAMQDNGRATIVGRRSYGKGVVNEDFVLRDSSVIRLTTKKFYTPSGRCIQKPYNGKLLDYDNELTKRFAHGEMYDADSINFPDSLKFTTKTGKTVYGGGGIMPDIFVPLDTTKYSIGFTLITEQSVIYDMAFDFTDKHREKLSHMSSEEIQAFCNKQFSITEVCKSVSATCKITQQEKELAKKLFRCYVVRNILGYNTFSKAYNADDKTIQAALHELER